jgi:hypothetical protein
VAKKVKSIRVNDEFESKLKAIKKVRQEKYEVEFKSRGYPVGNLSDADILWQLINEEYQKLKIDGYNL